VFPKEVAELFEREYGCTEADWQRCLPEAAGSHTLMLVGDDAAEIAIGAGRLLLHWTVLPPRQIALARLPRMAVSFRFETVPDGARQDFMRYFDLSMQRGGG
jgi:hypothetical protein